MIVSGATDTVPVIYSVPSSTTGDQTNTASASSCVPEPDAAIDSSSDTNPMLTRSDLTVTKSDGETSITAGDGVTHTYTITVHNAGPSDATNVQLSDVF